MCSKNVIEVDVICADEAGEADSVLYLLYEDMIENVPCSYNSDSNVLDGVPFFNLL